MCYLLEHNIPIVQWGYGSKEYNHIIYPIAFNKFSKSIITHTTNEKNDYKSFHIRDENLNSFYADIANGGTFNYIVIGV